MNTRIINTYLFLVLSLFQCLRSLADLRDSHRFPYKSLLDKAVGMAVQSMGPKLVLDAIPLQITGDLYVI